MLSYKEFLEVTRSYRREVERTYDEKREEDYELTRSENELAIVRLSRTSDPKDLARILTYLDDLLAEKNSEEDVIDYVKLSIILTYFKIIAQYSGYSATIFDQIYNVANLDYKGSTGGLIFVLESTRKNLPHVRCKVPLEATPGRIRTIIHETFIAMAALNPLRRTIPSFSYVYAFWECGSLMDAKTFHSGLCTSPGIRPVMIYEHNPEAVTLYDRMRDTKSPVSLKNVLDYLLQLMGALELANEYADYSHYDLHSGNVLVQPQDEELEINFQGYLLRTREIIIVIDNGLAYCRYSASAGRLSEPNSTAIELFGKWDSRLVDYGSTRNAVLGVQHDRSYPLGDAFRIFFDLYSLCSSEIQRQLRPLVGYFFTDPERVGKIETDLPPFKDEMFEYRYMNFAREILRNFQSRISEFVKPRALWLGIPNPAPGIRLDMVLDFRRVNPAYVPTTYEIGMISLLDNSLVFGEPPTEGIEYTLKQVRHLEGQFLEEILYGTAWRHMKEFSQEELKLEVILGDDFFSRYLGNLRRCVDHVMWIRGIYSATRVLFFALKKMGEARPLEMIANSLIVDPADIETLASYCKKARLPRYSKQMFENLLLLTEKITVLLSESRDDHKAEDNEIWYRACLPAARIYLEFGVQWGKLDASFGELSLPDLESR